MIIKTIDGDFGAVRYGLKGEKGPHRPNGPAVIFTAGHWMWHLFGYYHRYYGPQNAKGGWWIHGDMVKFTDYDKV